jgi:catechol-2,3-dioxygenase
MSSSAMAASPRATLSASTAPDSDRSARVGGVLETVLYGRELARLERFYAEVFGLVPIARADGRNVVLQCGLSVVILFNPDASGQPGRAFPPHGAEGCGHIAFVVAEEEMPSWRSRLQAHGVEVECEIEWPEGNRSLYLRDPAGNSVELAPPSLWGGLGARLLEAERGIA